MGSVSEVRPTVEAALKAEGFGVLVQLSAYDVDALIIDVRKSGRVVLHGVSGRLSGFRA